MSQRKTLLALPKPTMNPDPAIVEIVAIGKELTQGDVVDTNSAFIASRLLPLGLVVPFHTTVNDDRACIESALRTACARAQFVIVTGGLGPTDDDLTRDAIAAVCGVALELHEPSLARIEAIFSRRRVDMPACNRVQAMMPRGADVIPNPKGTAPGFAIEHDRALIVCMPGVPREMRSMLDAAIERITARVGVRQTGAVRLLNCFGLAESKINEEIGWMMAPDRNPCLGTMACDGVIRLRLLAYADSAEQANAALDAGEAAIRERLGDAVFGRGDETLAESVARELAAAKLTLATAESCTGGLIGHMLTQVSGISEWYVGGVVAYSNEIKAKLLGVPRELFDAVGAVSEEVARAMARGAAQRLGANIGVGVTGVAGPTGGTPSKPVGLVHAAMALGGEVMHWELRLFGDRETIKDRAAKSVLDMVRLALRRKRRA